jgi:uncharacterized protein
MTTLATELRKPLPFWDLFERLRSQGMALTLDHYDLLRRSILLGYVTTWEDLQEIGALLWVKPSEKFDRELFDQEFAAYHRNTNSEMPVAPLSGKQSTTKQETSSEPVAEVVAWPPLPLRPVTNKDIQVLSAVSSSTADQPASGKWKFKLTKLPISPVKVHDSWQAWRQLKNYSLHTEIDSDRTVAKISPMGWIEDIVWRSDISRKSQLVVLVNESDNMQTYLPAMTPLFEAIEQSRISPAKIYRFTDYPERVLYDWQKSTTSIRTEEVLKRLSSLHTTLLVISDCGAIAGFDDDFLIKGILKFLNSWQKNVRPILWLNPVPSDRWPDTPAAIIQRKLGRRMITTEQFNGLQMNRLMHSLMISGVGR